MNLTLLEPVRPLAFRVPPNKTNPTPFNSASNAGHVITSSIFLRICLTSGTLLADSLDDLLGLSLPARASSIFGVYLISTLSGGSSRS